MVTSNSGESRNRDTRSTGENRGYVKNNNGGENRYSDRNSKDGNRRYSKDFKSTRDSKSGSGDYKSGRSYSDSRYQRDSSNGSSSGGSGNGQDRKPGNRGSYNRNGDSKPGFNRYGGNKDTGRPYKKNFGDRSYGNPYDKDKDDDVRSNQRTRQSSNKDNKVKEQQPDKVDIINRIEKEKKAIQKKQAERKTNKAVRQQIKPKRTNNIDWTKEYENGSYDDDDLDIYL